MFQNGSFFAFLSVALYLIGSIPYLRGILRNQIVPHPFSFGVWSILTWVNLVILFQSGGGWGILPAMVEFGFVALWTFFWVLAFHRIHISAFDYICLALGIITLLIWLIFPPEYATFSTIVVEIVAFLPSVKKGWRDPGSETVLPWVMSGLFPIFLLISMPSHDFSNTGFWLFIACTNSSFAAMIYFRARYLSNTLVLIEE